MKKLVAAGAASLAFAAMPIVGAFAATSTPVTVTDTLEVKILTACTFGRWGVAGAAGQSTNVTVDPVWTSTTGASADPGTTDAGTYSATVRPGATVELGTSHFKGYCNSPSGFDVTVTTPSLENAAHDTIAYSASTPSSTDGWTLKKGANLFDNTASGAKFMHVTSATDASNPVEETATYTVYTTATTNAGVYTGNVVYSFTYDDPTSGN